MAGDFRFEVNHFIKAKSSGRMYRITGQRSDAHRKLKGGVGYSVVGRRNGEDFGPVRLMPETSFELDDYGAAS